MKKKLATILATVLAGSIMTAAPADATRIVPGALYHDYCTVNMPGLQNIFSVIRQEVIVVDKDKGICRPGPNWTGWKPCRNEDGPGPCIWDGRHMGNGTGRSYKWFGETDDRVAVYITHYRAHYLLTH